MLRLIFVSLIILSLALFGFAQQPPSPSTTPAQQTPSQQQQQQPAPPESSTAPPQTQQQQQSPAPPPAPSPQTAPPLPSATPPQQTAPVPPPTQPTQPPAQQPTAPPTPSTTVPMVSGAQPSQSQQTGAPLTLTLQDALARARANSVEFNAALTDQAIAHQDKVQARAALLPSVSYNTSAAYTQRAGIAAGDIIPPATTTAAATQSPRFIAANAVHEYVSQANAHEALGYGGIADYRRFAALEAVARAKTQIAQRGLVVTVVQAYYGLIAAQRKYANTQRAATEAERFLNISKQLENGGEVAHSDVIKAQIQYQDRQRDLREARLAMDKARLTLAVLLFPNFNENFTVVDDLDLAPPLMSFEEFAKVAQVKNPELRVASASLQAARSEVTSASAAYFPSLTLDYFYGIDATHYAIHTDGARNLGYSASATLSVPIWNWGATRSKVVQADLRRKQAQRELSLAQRKLLADIRNIYAEADAARAELDLLKSSAELAAESLRLTTLRYQAGEATVLEVVDAQNTLTMTQGAYHDGVVRYRAALADLQTLTGTM